MTLDALRQCVVERDQLGECPGVMDNYEGWKQWMEAFQENTTKFIKIHKGMTDNGKETTIRSLLREG